MRLARLADTSPLHPLNTVANGLLGLLMGLCLCLVLAHKASAGSPSSAFATKVQETTPALAPQGKLFLVSTLYPYDSLTRRSQSPYALTQFQALLGQGLAHLQQGQLSLTPNRETADYVVTLTCNGLRTCSRYQIAVDEADTHQTVVTFSLKGSWLPWGKPPVMRDSQQLAYALYYWLGQVAEGRGGAYD